MWVCATRVPAVKHTGRCVRSDSHALMDRMHSEIRWTEVSVRVWQVDTSVHDCAHPSMMACESCLGFVVTTLVSSVASCGTSKGRMGFGTRRAGVVQVRPFERSAIAHRACYTRCRRGRPASTRNAPGDPTGNSGAPRWPTSNRSARFPFTNLGIECLGRRLLDENVHGRFGTGRVRPQDHPWTCTLE
jgi:hypothetical protein